MVPELHETCRQLLEAGTVQAVIGYAQHEKTGAVYPTIVTEPAQVPQLLFHADCRQNLVAYLKRPDIRSLGKLAIIVKACDERALVVLQQESQIDRSQLVVIGVSCTDESLTQTGKCSTCSTKTPRFADVLIGEPPAAEPNAAGRYEELEQFMQLSAEERMGFWQREFARCTKCYACRQVCPLCYCRRCIADKNRPVCIETSPTLKGNFAWHITRAFHLAGRCVGCDACVEACPAGIDLRLLNQSLARAAEESFGYRAGSDPNAQLLVGAYGNQDHETFIQ